MYEMTEVCPLIAMSPAETSRPPSGCSTNNQGGSGQKRDDNADASRLIGDLLGMLFSCFDGSHDLIDALLSFLLRRSSAGLNQVSQIALVVWRYGSLSETRCKNPGRLLVARVGSSGTWWVGRSE